jgi:hypothetical protein
MDTCNERIDSCGGASVTDTFGGTTCSSSFMRGTCDAAADVVDDGRATLIAGIRLKLLADRIWPGAEMGGADRSEESVELGVGAAFGCCWKSKGSEGGDSTTLSAAAKYFSMLEICVSGWNRSDQSVTVVIYGQN